MKDPLFSPAEEKSVYRNRLLGLEPPGKRDVMMLIDFVVWVNAMYGRGGDLMFTKYPREYAEMLAKEHEDAQPG